MTDRLKLQEDEDYIEMLRCKDSIKSVQKKYPEGLKDKDIARALAISLKHMKLIYESALKKLRKKMLKAP